jgi:hypothetical protein
MRHLLRHGRGYGLGFIDLLVVAVVVVVGGVVFVLGVFPSICLGLAVVAQAILVELTFGTEPSAVVAGRLAG